MKYVKWSVYSEPGASEGFTPEPIIRERGGSADGGLFITDTDVIGYVSDDADLTNLEDYNVEEITQTEALALAMAVNPDCIIDGNGRIQSPVPTVGA
jgi:hypothetical protein